MTYGTGTFDFSPSPRGYLSRETFPHAVSGAVALILSMFVGGWVLYAHSIGMLFAPGAAPPSRFYSAAELSPAVKDTPEAFGALPSAPVASAVEAPPAPALPASPPKTASTPSAALTPDRIAEAPVGTPAAILASKDYIALLDPDYLLTAPASLDKNSPLAANFQLPPGAEAPAAVAENVRPVPLPPGPQQMVENVPLPTLRPPEFQIPASHGPARASSREVAQESAPEGTRERTTVAATVPTDNRSFFEKIFGGRESSGPELAYAAPEEPGQEQRSVAGSYDRYTAVYDISAHTVYLPDGTRLEAHSGRGYMLDNPRYVNQRMWGATPPDVYELKPREALFHGVQALRLIPVGDGNVYGRSGLLAHTYMLGPNGDSFGCVSFRNYNAFLQAYERGEIRRLAVVARMN